VDASVLSYINIPKKYFIAGKFMHSIFSQLGNGQIYSLGLMLWG
jgi:hypothetical protein